MIDKDEAIRLLRKEVANKGGDYIYEREDINSEHGGCVYFYQNAQPACIVGHAMADVGITAAQIGNRNGSSINANEFDDCVDQEASIVFRAAQGMQDSGNSWGEALKVAESRYRELGGTE